MYRRTQSRHYTSPSSPSPSPEIQVSVVPPTPFQTEHFPAPNHPSSSYNNLPPDLYHSPSTSPSSNDDSPLNLIKFESSPSPSLSPYAPRPAHLPALPEQWPVPKPKSSHAKKQPEGHIKRPKNAFILFRSWCVKYRHYIGEETDHRKISQLVGQAWHDIAPEQRAYWENEARKEKEAHKAAYPDYRYSPMYKKDGAAATTSNAGSVVRRRKGATSPVPPTEEDRRVRRAPKTRDAGNESDDGSDFEASMAAKKRRSRKRTTAPKPEAYVYDATFDFPFPSMHAMTTRRRSSSTPSYPAESLLAGPSTGRRRSHVRTLSDQSVYSAPTAKTRTTNNSLSTMAASAVKIEEPVFNNPIAYGQSRIHNKRLDFEQMRGSPSSSSRLSTPVAIPRLSTPVPNNNGYLSSPALSAVHSSPAFTARSFFSPSPSPAPPAIHSRMPMPPSNLGLQTMHEDFEVTNFEATEEPQQFAPGVEFQESFAPGGDALESGYMAESLQDLFATDLNQTVFGGSPCSLGTNWLNFSFPTANASPAAGHSFGWFPDSAIEPLSLPAPSWPHERQEETQVDEADMASYLRALDATGAEGSE